jgi:hypothetical protein
MQFTTPAPTGHSAKASRSSRGDHFRDQTTGTVASEWDHRSPVHPALADALGDAPCVSVPPAAASSQGRAFIFATCMNQPILSQTLRKLPHRSSTRHLSVFPLLIKKLHARKQGCQPVRPSLKCAGLPSSSIASHREKGLCGNVPIRSPASQARRSEDCLSGSGPLTWQGSNIRC